MKQTVNHDIMRSTNLLGVFNCVRRNAPVTKRQIQSITGLSWGCVSNLCTILQAKGIISETKGKNSGAGRTPSGFDINLADNFIIGLDVNLIGLTGVVIDLSSRVKTCVHQTLAAESSGSIITQMRQILRGLVDGAPQGAVKGIAVAFPGHVDAGVAVWTHQFGSVKRVNISQILQAEFGVPVLLEHDPNCMAVTEHLLGAAQDLENFMFVRLSVGIGMGIMSGGEIYKGSSGATGELGHITMLPDGEPCRCGNHGCLETCASVQAILTQCEKAVQAGQAPILQNLAAGGALTLDLAAQAATAGDTAVTIILKDAARWAGIAIANAVNLIDPGAVVLGGELAQQKELFLQPLVEEVNSRKWSSQPVSIRTSTLGANSAAIGAASLFIRQVFLGLAEENTAPQEGETACT